MNILRCPTCGAGLPPPGPSGTVECQYCHGAFTAVPGQPQMLAELPAPSAEMPALVAEARGLVAELRTAFEAYAARTPAGMEAMTAMARTKLDTRIRETEAAIARGDEATLRDCMGRMRVVAQMQSAMRRP